MTEIPIKIGVVGPGLGAWQLKHCKLVPGVKIQALCEQNAEILRTNSNEYSAPQTFTAFD